MPGRSSQGQPFPVLVFEPGLGPLLPEYTTLVEDLASRGYVVIGLNPTYSASITVLDGQVVKSTPLGSIPDNASPEELQQRGDRLVGVWAADDRFAMDEATRLNDDPGSPFAGRLDVGHIGLLGHSFGGAAALEACHLDARCTAAADLDGTPFGGVVQTGLDRPVLLMLSETESKANTPAMQQSNQALAAHLRRIAPRLSGDDSGRPALQLHRSCRGIQSSGAADRYPRPYRRRARVAHRLRLSGRLLRSDPQGPAIASTPGSLGGLSRGAVHIALILIRGRILPMNTR